MSSRQSESMGSRWFPTKDQLADPEKLLSTMRQVLQQHYALVDDFAKYRKENPPKAPAPSGPPPGSGPTDSMLLGLRVAPVDVNTLANGATLKFVKAAGNFQFS